MLQQRERMSDALILLLYEYLQFILLVYMLSEYFLQVRAWTVFITNILEQFLGYEGRAAAATANNLHAPFQNENTYNQSHMHHSLTDKV